MSRIGLIAGLAMASATVGNAQQPQGPPPCQTPEHRQFDFWLGNWDVFGPQGQRAGVNVIERGNGGCSLHESYVTPSGYMGNSYNIFDQSRGKWHQTWVDNGGLLLVLEGEFRDGSMIMEGETLDQQGQTVLNRITWTPLTADSVQQLWESSNDGGATWTTGFDGRYVRQ